MFFNQSITKVYPSQIPEFQLIKIFQSPQLKFHTNPNTSSHTDLGYKYLIRLKTPHGRFFWFSFNYTIFRKPKVSIKKGFALEAQEHEARFKTPHYQCCTRCVGLKGWSSFQKVGFFFLKASFSQTVLDILITSLSLFQNVRRL